MNLSVLGLDEAFDRTAVETRRQAAPRIVISVLVFLTGLTAIPLASLLVWATMYLIGDSTLWVATDPERQARHPVFFRVLRLFASCMSTCAWVTIGWLWWWAPGAHSQVVAVALITGVLLYVVRSCHRSLAHMAVTGLPPSVMLLVLPFTLPDFTNELGLIWSMILVVAFAVSSCLNAWRSHRVLVDKQHEAEVASVAKSEFLANMSHEIRTPLNGVLAMAHVLNEADLRPREQEAARMICASGEMLERLLSDILDLAKVEAGQLEIEAAPFHAGDLVRNVVAMCRPRADEKGLPITIEIDPVADRTYVGDAVRVRQVIINLVSNAVKFTTSGEVRLALKVGTEGRLRFEVSDTGEGFEPALKARLFDRFQQADGSITRRFGGSGLGLAISKHLAKVMGGTLDCDSTPGIGSVFWFEAPLPVAEAPGPECVNAPSGTMMSAMRLLVADDHPTNLRVVEIILRDVGIEVTSVVNGLEAVQAHAVGAYDLILMDMQMPVMDGMTAVAEIRATEARTDGPRTPIIMLTANAMPEQVRAGRLAGADAHLSKPITPASLLQAITDVSAGDLAAPDLAEAVQGVRHR
ncbi:ATP-binding protein [uncultured Brevundimonas sp.]|mgnify:CR=1 FL=1|uniref:ATP-binding protein n=1 Tax=uncultured Brevundimonas sp. TaxID=213418 RepID=UPI0030EE11A9|tara:strand:+ start:16384 stop:18126 length:1743 start_codon:yes stop_codon:yes gene_type:complete